MLPPKPMAQQNLIGDFSSARQREAEMLAARQSETPEIGDFSQARMISNQSVGLFPYLKNMAESLWTLHKATKGVRDEDTNKLWSALESTDPSFDHVKEAAKDWIAVLGKIGQVVTDPTKATGEFAANLPANVEAVKGGVSGVADMASEGGIPALAGMLAKAMVEPIGDLFESTVGVQMADGSFRELTTEEKEFKLKNAVGFGVSLAIGGALARGPLAISSEIERAALSRTLSALKAGDRTVDVDLLEMVNRAKQGASGARIPKGKLAAEVIGKGTALGAVTGAGYAGITFANEDDMLAQMFLEGVIFAPLGVAFETLGLRGANKAYTESAKIADNIANLRQVQNVRHNTIAGVVSNIDAMMRGDDLAEALLAQFENNPISIARITPEQVGSIQDLLKDKNLVTIQSVTKDGIHRALVTSPEIASRIDKPFFTRTGLIKDQYVSHNGRDYIVVGDEGIEGSGNVKLQEVHRERFEADLGETKELLDAIESYQIDLVDLDRHIEELREDLLVQQKGDIKGSNFVNIAHYKNLLKEALEEHETSTAELRKKEWQLKELESKKLGTEAGKRIKSLDKSLEALEAEETALRVAVKSTKSDSKEFETIANQLDDLMDKKHELRQEKLMILAGVQDVFSEVPLSEVRSISRPEGSYPIERVHHGTPRVFDEFDPAVSSEGNLYGPAVGYFTESGGLSSTYTSKGLYSGDDPVTAISDFEGRIKTNQALANKIRADLEVYEESAKNIPTDAHPDAAENHRDMIADLKARLKEVEDALKFDQSEIDRLLPEAAKTARHVRVHALDIRNPFDIDRPVPPVEVARIMMPVIPDSRNFRNSDVVKEKLAKIRTGQDLYDALTTQLNGDLREVNKHLKKMGYDAITHIGGRMMGDKDHRVWIPIVSKDQVKASTWRPEYPPVRSGPARGIGVETDFEPVGNFRTQMDNVYRNFKHKIFSNVTIDSYVPPQGWSFEADLRSFAQELGITHQELPAFRDAMRSRMRRDLAEQLSPNDRAFILAAEKVAIRESNIRHALDSNTLVAHANNNGMVIDVEDAGRIVIRDLESGKELHRTSTFSDAQTFIDRTGQAEGPSLDFAGGDLPPIAPHLFSAPDNSNPIPPNLLKQGRINMFNDVVNVSMPYFARNREIFTSMDNRFGTKMFAKVFDSLQEVTIKRNAAIRPYYERLQKIDDLVVGMSSAERQRIGDYLETMTPEEVVDRYLASRKMTDFEKTAAQVIVDGDADLKKIFEYRRMLKDWQEDAAKGRIPDVDTPEKRKLAYEAKVEELRQGLGLTEGDLTGVKLFDEVSTMNKDMASIGAISRLARAMRGADGKPEMTRMQFAARHKLSKKQVQVAHELEKMWKDLAKEFDIDEKQMLNGYMTHAALYSEGQVEIGLRDFPTDKTKTFYARLSRTGELGTYERDPIAAMQRYIKAGFDEKMVNSTATRAKQAVVDEIESALADGRIKDSRAGRDARTIAERYISDVQGHGDAGGRMIQEVVDNFFRALGKEQLSPDVRRKIVNVISSTGEAAAQGLRVAAGIRDFFSGYAVSVMRYGPAETNRIITYGVNGLDKMTPAELAKMGEIPESGIVNFSDPVEHSGSLIKGARGQFVRKLDKFNQFAFRMSMQKDVYRMWHAGHYLATFKRAGDALADYRANKIDIHELNRRTLLYKYDNPIIEEFMRLVEEGKSDENATRFLARQTGQDMVGVYGFANHPSGWNTDVGRVAGQFGQWSMWFRQAFVRETTRGTLTQRSAAMARLMATQKILVGVGAMAGLNLTRWQPTDGLFFGGGPVVDFALTLAKATTGSGYAQEEAQRRLSRYFPYANGQFNIGQIYLPGSFFAQDLLKAYELLEQGDPRGYVRALGVPVETDYNSVKRVGPVPVGGITGAAADAVGLTSN